MMLSNQIGKIRISRELDCRVPASGLGPITASSLFFRHLRWDIAQPDVMTVDRYRRLDLA